MRNGLAACAHTPQMWGKVAASVRRVIGERQWQL